MSKYRRVWNQSFQLLSTPRSRGFRNAGQITGTPGERVEREEGRGGRKTISKRTSQKCQYNSVPTHAREKRRGQTPDGRDGQVPEHGQNANSDLCKFPKNPSTRAHMQCLAEALTV